MESEFVNHQMHSIYHSRGKKSLLFHLHSNSLSVNAFQSKAIKKIIAIQILCSLSVYCQQSRLRV